MFLILGINFNNKSFNALASTISSQWAIYTVWFSGSIMFSFTVSTNFKIAFFLPLTLQNDSILASAEALNNGLISNKLPIDATIGDILPPRAK